jgi:hypothetical protein
MLLLIHLKKLKFSWVFVNLTKRGSLTTSTNFDCLKEKREGGKRGE